MTVLALIPDILLLVATVALAVYCHRLARRLRTFRDAEAGIGGTISDLSERVDAMRASLDSAAAEGDARGERLAQVLGTADDRIAQLEMLLDSLEDVESTFVERGRGEDGEAAPPALRFRTGGAARGTET